MGVNDIELGVLKDKETKISELEKKIEEYKKENENKLLQILEIQRKYICTIGICIVFLILTVLALILCWFLVPL